MVITARSNSSSPKGARPINMNKDLPQVVRLLEQVFGESVRDGQQIFSPGGLADTPAFLWRLNANMSRLSPGFVWEEDGRIIGNVTLLPSQPAGRFLIANVAVHPDYRRRGIARLLMNEVLAEVQQRNGRTALLQVDKENGAAVALYRQLGFESLGHMSHWRSTPTRLRLIKREDETAAWPAPSIRPLPHKRWSDAYKLDRQALPTALDWPDILPADSYKRGWWQRLGDFLNGRNVERWVTQGDDGKLTGLATIHSEWGQPHYLKIRIHPDWQGQLERPLLAKLIRRLGYLPQRNIRIDHLDNDEMMNKLLREANFTIKRTLTHMRLFL